MRLGGSILVGVLIMAPSVTAADSPRRAAETFGRALTSSDVTPLRAILPEKGKVRLKLVRMGPEDGWYGPAQVEAIFGDFLAEGAVGSFEIERIDGDDRTYSLVRAKAAVTDRAGRRVRVTLHLSFEPEAQRWVLREIKELPG